MNKKQKENRYRPPTGKAPASTDAVMPHMVLGLKVIVMGTLVLSTTLFFIFVENAVTQSHTFCIDTISVSGNVSLSKNEIIDQSALHPGDNLLEHNLRHVRERLLAHPWIADADVKRILPSTIDITIQEEKVIAVVQIEDRTDLLMNMKGQPFVENDAIGSPVYDPSSPESPQHPLPVISGLSLKPLLDHRYGFSGKLHEAVLNLLTMEKSERIERIVANDETGIEVLCTIGQRPFVSDNPTHLDPLLAPHSQTNGQLDTETNPEVDLSGMTHNEHLLINNDQFDPMKTVKEPSVVVRLGFDQYEEKFKKIRHIVKFMQKNDSTKRICSIDLINPENIVIQLKPWQGLPQRQQGGA